MADKKISQLTAATTPLAGTEVLPIVQSGSTVKVSAADVTAGRAVSALSLTLTGSPLAATSGGTGQSSAFTANGVPYASSTSALATGTVLSFDGSLLSVSSAGAKAQVVSGSLNNTGTALLVQNDNKTTGKLARFYSNNGSASNSGNLVEIVNDFNSGGTADLLYLQQDDDGDGLQIVMDRGGAGLKITAGSGNCAELTAGNLKFMTAGKGIDFSANTGAAGMTSELLNWYEEGTWTPQVYYQNATDQGNATDVTQVGHYTRVGNVVVANCYLTWTITGTPANDNVGIKNLPFTIKNSANYYPIAGAILGGADTNPTYGGWMVQGQPNTKVAIIFTGVNGDNQGNEVGTAGTKSLFFTLSYLV